MIYCLLFIRSQWAGDSHRQRPHNPISQSHAEYKHPAFPYAGAGEVTKDDMSFFGNVHFQHQSFPGSGNTIPLQSVSPIPTSIVQQAVCIDCVSILTGWLRWLCIDTNVVILGRMLLFILVPPYMEYPPHTDSPNTRYHWAISFNLSSWPPKHSVGMHWCFVPIRNSFMDVLKCDTVSSGLCITSSDIHRSIWSD